MALATSQMLQDRYRIASLLGQGGMGAVYRAWDTRLNIPVALKEMVPQAGLDSQTLTQLRRQFQQEAQIMARLTHPHLVRVGDFFQERGNAYLVMDFVEGEDLSQLIKREGALSEEQVLEWAGQLLDALAYCHGQGIIHRDVKPQNVIIRPDRRAVLVDFGLVKLWDPNDPRTKTVMRGMGTPEYAPPEQYEVKAGHTDARSDIYGLGATLYPALAGQAPPTATLRIAEPEQFLPLRLVAPKVSKQTEAALMKSLELARSQRWQSAAEMAQSLGLSIRYWGEEKAAKQAVPLLSGRGGTRLIEKSAQARPASRRTGLPFWAWALGGLAILAVIGLALGSGAIMLGLPSGLNPSKTTPTAVATTPSATIMKEETDTPISSPPPTGTATRPPISTSTKPPTDTPAPTDTPTRIPPTRTSAPQAIPPQPLAPAQGGEFQNPITFEWSGSLGAGQTYQVTAYHSGSGYALQSDLLTTQTWTIDLPGDRIGEWRWSVAVIQEGIAAITSSEGMFWFNPFPGGGGGGGGGDGPEPTWTSPPVNP
ncbi:MAG: hypothetical protein DRJ03_17520 [Chloroflexi bacterium]|nr:MAG: hypothetical protein DRJ03_17520 [Chloroflexota bacterium]